MNNLINIKRAVFIFVMFFLMVFVPVFLYPVEVDWVSGDAVYSHLKGEWKDLEVGMRLVSGDIIKTGEDGEVTLTSDGAIINISPLTKFTVAEKYEGNERRSAFMLFLGRIKFKLGKKSGKNEPEIVTQSVNLTIRGTEFDVASGHDGSTIVAIKEGSVAVKGRRKVLVLDKGEGTQVDFGQEPERKFKLITKVIDWDKWLRETQENVKGNEKKLLIKILGRFEEIDRDIKKYERIRAGALEEKKKMVQKRDKLREMKKYEEAREYSKQASLKGKLAYHSIVNIRFLALSSIGLKDMADNIYRSVKTPDKETISTYRKIESIYSTIEKKYILPGDREVIEKKASRKRGCFGLF